MPADGPQCQLRNLFRFYPFLFWIAYHNCRFVSFNFNWHTRHTNIFWEPNKRNPAQPLFWDCLYLCSWRAFCKDTHFLSKGWLFVGAFELPLGEIIHSKVWTIIHTTQMKILLEYWLFPPFFYMNCAHGMYLQCFPCLGGFLLHNRSCSIGNFGTVREPMTENCSLVFCLVNHRLTQDKSDANIL